MRFLKSNTASVYREASFDRISRDLCAQQNRTGGKGGMKLAKRTQITASIINGARPKEYRERLAGCLGGWVGGASIDLRAGVIFSRCRISTLLLQRIQTPSLRICSRRRFERKQIHETSRDKILFVNRPAAAR